MDVNAVINSHCLVYHSQREGKVLNNSIMTVTYPAPVRVIVSSFDLIEPKSLVNVSEIAMS